MTARVLSRAVRVSFRASLGLSRALGALRRAAVPALAAAWAVVPVAGPFLYLPVVLFVGLSLAGWPLPVRVLCALAGPVVYVLLEADTGRRLDRGRLEQRLTDAGRSSRQRLAAARVRHRWQDTLEQLGWADETRPTRLRHVEDRGDGLRVVFRPPPGTRPERWPELVDGLRRHLGMHSARHAEHPTEPGTIVATFGPEPLPHRVDAGPAVGAPPLQGGGHVVELGPRGGGGVARWVLGESPHLLVAGSTGGGKGGVLRLIAQRLLTAGVRVWVIDPKGTGEWRWAHETGAQVTRDLTEGLDVLRAAVREIRERCDLTWQNGVDKVTALHPELRPPPLVVILDEAADLLMLRRVPAERQADELRAEAGSLAAVIASQGRAADVHLVVAIQRPDIALLGPAGGFLRENLPGRLGLGRVSVEGLDMLLGPGHRDLALTGTPGRAIATHLAAGDTTPTVLQVAHLDASDLLPAGWAPDAREAA
ncbi:MAG: FtsK/SpoIIIE domain-containing protein [Thermoleophilia bacterium]